MQPSEEQVYIDKVKKGDSAAYRYLVDKYQDMAYTIALRIMRQAEDAEDAAQEGFVKAYQQLHSFEGKSKFSTWLYTIIYRTCLSKLQKQRIPAYPMEEGIDDTDDTVPPLDILETMEKQTYIREAIGRLPSIDGVLITLYYLNENSIREMAEITGLSESNIKVKLFRARKTLEQQLRFLL
ncbi:RNA polymerase sigma factor [Salmonirosea aquatica]|uniref:Sigma-70 family RNA polymerase sigma factor n=1 Tax=Salmonirosea aquatica TaxID=2654236 RepID=A0A7C9BIT1_9BACT|nr:sigma-70 family RNA polymerase sigma factor [Cytophagaceae bacterium SJW1-29]